MMVFRRMYRPSIPFPRQIAVCKGPGARRYRWYRLLQGPGTCQEISTIAELDRERLDCNAQETRAHGCQLSSLRGFKLCHLVGSMIDSTRPSYTSQSHLVQLCLHSTHLQVNPYLEMSQILTNHHLKDPGRFHSQHVIWILCPRRLGFFASPLPPRYLRKEKIITVDDSITNPSSRSSTNAEGEIYTYLGRPGARERIISILESIRSVVNRLRYSQHVGSSQHQDDHSRKACPGWARGVTAIRRRKTPPFNRTRSAFTRHVQKSDKIRR